MSFCVPASPRQVVFALHAHLPWVRHPGQEEHPEERWLFDAITDTYLPLLDRLGRLRDDGVPTRITLSLSPTLLGMLTDPLLQSRYMRHLERLILFADSEVGRLRHEPQWQRLAVMYRDTFREARRMCADRFGGHLVAAFRDLAETGVVELVATAAAHALLPLHTTCPEVTAAQIDLGVEEFQRHFGWAPAGFWLPECGYSHELDAPLSAAGIRWTMVEGHGLALARPAPALGLRAPVVTPSGLAVLGRDRGLARVAWSTRDGYPGSPEYRDFDSDVGFELPLEALRRILPASQERVPTGLKYQSLGNIEDEPRPYDPDQAHATASTHARNFVSRCAEWLASENPPDRPSSLVVAYDAELFGHWWYEGHHWLDQVVRQMACEQNGVVLATPSEVLTAAPVLQVAEPAASTWGEGGYHEPWIRGENDWLYRPLQDAAHRMVRLARKRHDATSTHLRALNQAAREILLAQASDWPLMMSRGTSTEYAIGRARGHLVDFNAIADALESGEIDLDWLSEIESRNSAFPAIDFRVFARELDATNKNENGAAR